MGQLSTTADDKSAWDKVKGSFDDLSDGSAYVIEGLKAVEQGRDPLTKNRTFGKAVLGADVAQKAYSYGKKATELVDEKTRDGAILKIGVDLAIDVVGKVLGASLSTHPYYVYHKVMIEYLAGALDAHRNAKEAIAQYRKAVSAATSKALADEFKRLESRKVSISANYVEFRDTVGIAVDIYHGRLSKPMINDRIKRYGSKRIGSALVELQVWRMAWVGLSFEAIKLQVMAKTELNIAQKAMAKVGELVHHLMKGNSLSQVSGVGARNQIEWEKYDQLVNQGKPQQAVMDPVAYAAGNVAKATAWAEEISAMADFARTSDAVFGTLYNKQLEKLNKVLYG